MFTKSQLDQFQKLLESNNKKIIKDIHQEIKTAEQKLRQEIQTVQTNLHKEIQTVEQNLRLEIQTSNKQLEIKLTRKFDTSQEEMIGIISELINTGYNIHEIRIKRVEDELSLPPIKN